MIVAVLFCFGNLVGGDYKVANDLALVSFPTFPLLSNLLWLVRFVKSLGS